jgi:hypothetical protein
MPGVEDNLKDRRPKNPPASAGGRGGFFKTKDQRILPLQRGVGVGLKENKLPFEYAEYNKKANTGFG